MAKHSFFVTGTDTGVGKTLVSSSILEAAAGKGWRTLGMKPIASGCDETPEGLRNEDALALMASMTESLSYEMVNPIALEPAIAPHVAAAQAGKQVTASRLVGFCRGVMTRPADLLLVEGAGGWRVPLNNRETFSALPVELGMPVILVVPLKLGCINHALLTAEAIRRDGLTVAAWVANHPDADIMQCEKETLEYLVSHLGAPCLGVLPWQETPSPSLLANRLDLDVLIEK